MKRALWIVGGIALFVSCAIMVPYTASLRERGTVDEALKGRLVAGMTREEAETLCESLGYNLNYLGIGSEKDKTQAHSYLDETHPVWIPFGGWFRTKLVVDFSGDSVKSYRVEVLHEML